MYEENCCFYIALTPEGVTTNVGSDSFRSHLDLTPEGVTTNVGKFYCKNATGS
jgi:hypothetical protein